MPTGFASTGLPLSMQIIGKPFDEATVYRVARAYEQATPWTTMHPVLDVHFVNPTPVLFSVGKG